MSTVDAALREARFNADWPEDADGILPAFNGFTAGEVWNGWACPYFAVHEAHRLLDYLLRTGIRCWYDPDQDTFYFDANFDHGYGVPELEAYTGVDFYGHHLYPIGAESWTWDELDET